MLNDELYIEIRRVIYKESQKFADTVADKCIKLIETYSSKDVPDFTLQEYEEPPCTMPVFDTVDDIISAMSESFEKARQKQSSTQQNQLMK